MDKRMERLKNKFKVYLGYATWILVIFFLVSTVRNINRAVNIKKQVESEQQKVVKMQADNASLQAQIAEAQGTDFIDRQIRNKLGLSKDGEAVVVLPEESIVRAMAPPEVNDVETLPDPNWKKWQKLFF